MICMFVGSLEEDCNRVLIDESTPNSNRKGKLIDPVKKIHEIKQGCLEASGIHCFESIPSAVIELQQGSEVAICFSTQEPEQTETQPRLTTSAGAPSACPIKVLKPAETSRLVEGFKWIMSRFQAEQAPDDADHVVALITA